MMKYNLSQHHSQVVNAAHRSHNRQQKRARKDDLKRVFHPSKQLASANLPRICDEPSFVPIADEVSYDMQYPVAVSPVLPNEDERKCKVNVTDPTRQPHYPAKSNHDLRDGWCTFSNAMVSSKKQIQEDFDDSFVGLAACALVYLRSAHCAPSDLTDDSDEEARDDVNDDDDVDSCLKTPLLPEDDWETLQTPNSFRYKRQVPTEDSLSASTIHTQQKNQGEASNKKQHRQSETAGLGASVSRNGNQFIVSGLRLAMPNDSQELNSLHCFVRSELLEVFTLVANLTRTKSLENKRQRVGLRCIHCSHLPRKHRVGISMSTFFPKSVNDLYRSVCTWQRIHFKSCPHIPDTIRETYWRLKDTDRSRGKKAYWVESALRLGLRDADQKRGGVVFDPNHHMDFI